MKKLVLAALALAGVTAFMGASAAPAAAPQSDARVAHTVRWKLTETAAHDVARFSFVGTDRIRSVRTGEIIGFDSFTGQFSGQSNSGRIDVAASVKGGTLIYRVRVDFTSGDEVFRGRVLKGTGKFAGADGTVRARPIGGGEAERVLVTIRYTV